MKNIIISFLIALMVSAGVFPAVSQGIRKPENGADGISGRYNRSFVISWESIPGVSMYEYILTNNPSCYAGCAGDTRQKVIADTAAVEFGLLENTWYYWIFQPYLNDTTDGGWSAIYSFLTREGEGYDFVRIYPNPSSPGEISVLIDWTVDPSIQGFHVEISDQYGRKIKQPSVFYKSESLFRSEIYYFDASQLPSGGYFLDFVPLIGDIRGRTLSKKLILY